MKKFIAYFKDKKILENIICPLLLIAISLSTITRGVDVSDTTYSLGNYMYSGRLSGMWVCSTYISNLIGSLLVHLPWGDHLLVANIYTSLVLAAIGLTVYFALKKDSKYYIIFLGEFIAIAFCWIPTGILYNYLSYLFLTIGALLIYRGTIRSKRKYFFIAGIILGLNVFVRIPNVTQAALIIAVLSGCFIYGNKDYIRRFIYCFTGYLIGMAVPVVLLIIRFGSTAITDMISGLFGITSTDDSYTPVSMITDTINAYIRSSKWVMIILICTLLGVVMFKFLPGKYERAKKIIYIIGIAIMLRFLWGRGMFSFRYYEDYTSMCEWGMMALYISIAVAIYALISKKSANQTKMLAIIALVIIVISPLGSNNYTYQNFNNMFLVMPFTVCMLYDVILELKEKPYSYPVAGMLITVMAMIFIQTFCFHTTFTFKDGMDGTPRETAFSEIPSLKGMKSTEENVAALEDLYLYVNRQKASEAIYFGDCPGLTYILEIPSALSTSWADLDSYSEKELMDSLEKIEGRHPIIIFQNVEPSSKSSETKREHIINFIGKGGYRTIYRNKKYTVYK